VVVASTRLARRDQGPGTRDRDQGEGAWTRDRGQAPGTRTRDQGPWVRGTVCDVCYRLGYWGEISTRLQIKAGFSYEEVPDDSVPEFANAPHVRH